MKTSHIHQFNMSIDLLRMQMGTAVEQAKRTREQLIEELKRLDSFIVSAETTLDEHFRKMSTYQDHPNDKTKTEEDHGAIDRAQREALQIVAESIAQLPSVEPMPAFLRKAEEIPTEEAKV